VSAQGGRRNDGTTQALADGLSFWQGKHQVTTLARDPDCRRPVFDHRGRHLVRRFVPLNDRVALGGSVEYGLVVPSRARR